jgi:hypothetical protein
MQQCTPLRDCYSLRCANASPARHLPEQVGRDYGPIGVRSFFSSPPTDLGPLARCGSDGLEDTGPLELIERAAVGTM